MGIKSKLTHTKPEMNLLKKTRFTLLALPFLVAGVFAVTNTADAQSRVAITPLVFELTGEPGEVLENHIRVMNPSYDDRITVKIEVEGLVSAGEGGQTSVASSEEADTFSLVRWIETSAVELTLEPREERPVAFTIRVPENAEPGGHYATLLAGTTAVEGTGNLGVGVKQRIGAAILLTVPGEMQEEMEILGLEAPAYSERGPITLTTRFENTGTVHVRPKATITVTNMFGQKVAELEVPDNIVLPGAIRRLEAEWDVDWLFGGRYTATVSGTYGKERGSFDSQVTTFWVFPWKLGVAIILLLLFFYATRRRWAIAFSILIKGEAPKPKKK